MLMQCGLLHFRCVIWADTVLHEGRFLLHPTVFWSYRCCMCAWGSGVFFFLPVYWCSNCCRVSVWRRRWLGLEYPFVSSKVVYKAAHKLHCNKNFFLWEDGWCLSTVAAMRVLFILGTGPPPLQLWPVIKWYIKSLELPGIGGKEKIRSKHQHYYIVQFYIYLL